MLKTKRVCAALLLALCVCGSAMAEEPTRAVLSFAGDCTLGSMKEFQRYSGEFVSMIAELGFDHPFSGARRLFAEDDLTLVNLEGVFTNEKKSMDKKFVFKAPPEYAAILPLGSVEAVNIANNHIRDFLEQGRADTLAALNEYGVLYSGDGILSVYDTNGITVGMTGYSYPHYHTLESLALDIEILRAQGCDLIVFSMHMGTEEEYKTGSGQRDLARGAIDLGADIVVGHHPHVLQSVEVYQGKPIFYSLGNFAFGGNKNPKDWDTMVAQVTAEKDENGTRLVMMQLHPFLISDDSEGRRGNFCPVPATGERAEAILAKIARYSTDVDPSLFDEGILFFEK